MTIRDDILQAARDRFGIPYGLPPGPGETDCSLYALTVYEAAGVPFPPGIRTAEQIRAATDPIDFDNVEPGDLLFFERTYDITEPSRVGDGHVASHIGISLGAGTRRMLNAVEPVSKETDISTDYWQEHILSAGRAPQLVDAPVPAGGMSRGIDVSSHQGSIDWPAVAASGISFAFIKATEGTDYINPNFAHGWLMARRLGLSRGAYHFADPGENSAEDEAAWFLEQIEEAGGLAAGDLLALDLESGSGDLGPWTLAWLHAVEREVSFKPLVYTGAWFSVPHNLGAYPDLGQYGLWLAAYQEQMPSPPQPWAFVAVWQHSDAGQVPGIRGAVDLDLFNGDISRLPLYGKPSTPPPPAPDPTPGVTRADIDEVIAQLAVIRSRLPA